MQALAVGALIEHKCCNSHTGPGPGRQQRSPQWPVRVGQHVLYGQRHTATLQASHQPDII